VQDNNQKEMMGKIGLLMNIGQSKRKQENRVTNQNKSELNVDDEET
jgi:hypothetical protein